MAKLSTAMVRPILETMYDHRREMVPLFIGAPGIGKTQGLYEFAQDKEVNVVTFILSNTVPSEVSGIRMPDQESKRLEVFDDKRMASLKDGDVLFFDEILEAPPMLWSAVLTLIQDRILASGRKLPDVFIVAASNQVVSPGIIPPSVRDRFMTIELEFDARHWCEWFKDKFGVYPADISRLIKEDSDQYNILTPRRVVKLYTWLKQDCRPPEWDTKKKIISAMFDGSICELLIKLVKHVDSPQVQIKNAINESIVGGAEITMNFEDMSLREIMQYLQERPEWGAIQETLAGIELQEQEDEDYEY